MDLNKVGSGALVLFLPDAMRLGLWREMGADFCNERIYVHAAIPVQLTPALHVELYGEALAHQVGPERMPARWLLPNLFTLDMGIAVVLRSDRPGLQERVNHMKGSAQRSGRVNPSLRGYSPLSERGMSLIHVPDSEAERDRQAELLFGGIPFTQLAGARTSGPVDPADLGRLRGYVPLERDQAPWALSLRLIDRALAALLWDPRMTVDERLAIAFARIGEEISARSILLPAWLSEIALLAHRAQPPVFLPTVEGVLRHKLHCQHGDLLAAISALARPQELTMRDGPRLAELFQRNGLFLDPWEQL